jgi:hypothetical protein
MLLLPAVSVRPAGHHICPPPFTVLVLVPQVQKLFRLALLGLTLARPYDVVMLLLCHPAGGAAGAEAVPAGLPGPHTCRTV